MDNLERNRLKSIAKLSRKVKIVMQTLLREVGQWNGWMPLNLQLKPNRKVIEAAMDALMDLNNACTDRERNDQREEARSKVKR